MGTVLFGIVVLLAGIVLLKEGGSWLLEVVDRYRARRKLREL